MTASASSGRRPASLSARSACCDSPENESTREMSFCFTTCPPMISAIRAKTRPSHPQMARLRCVALHCATRPVRLVFVRYMSAPLSRVNCLGELRLEAASFPWGWQACSGAATRCGGTATRMGFPPAIGDNRRMKRRVLIVDDHAGFRASARRVLEAGGYSVVAEAENGSAGVSAAAESRPDLALVDVQLPDFDGFEVT